MTFAICAIRVRSIETEEAAERAEASAAVSETIDQVAATAEDAAQKVNDQYQSAAEKHPRAPPSFLCSRRCGRWFHPRPGMALIALN